MAFQCFFLDGFYLPSLAIACYILVYLFNKDKRKKPINEGGQKAGGRSQETPGSPPVTEDASQEGATPTQESGVASLPAPHSPGQMAGGHFLFSCHISWPCSSCVMSFGLENGIPAHVRNKQGKYRPWRPGAVMNTCNPSYWEAEAGGLWGQLDYTVSEDLLVLHCENYLQKNNVNYCVSKHIPKQIQCAFILIWMSFLFALMLHRIFQCSAD